MKKRKEKKSVGQCSFENNTLTLGEKEGEEEEEEEEKNEEKKIQFTTSRHSLNLIHFDTKIRRYVD